MNKFLLIFKFETSNNKEYKIKTIQNNAVYTKKIGGHLLGLYYLAI